MLRTRQILTRANDKRQVVSLNLTQKIILTLVIAAFATVPLWLGLARVHSAPANVAIPPVLPPPTVVLNVPSEVLIGEDFEFEVRLKNNLGSPIGYAPYVEIYSPASGVDANSLGLKCDGITILSARAEFTSPPSLTLPFAQDSGLDSSPCPNSYSTHKFTGATLFTPPPPQYQLVVIPLPFGSFDPTQPENIVKVKAHLSDYADAGMPLTIYAKGGFRYGTDEKDNHPSDPLVESTPISAQTTPTLFKIKKEYLGPEDEAVSGPNFVNYYPLKYKVTVDIANQQEIQNLVVTDNLPANLQFNGNVQVTIQGNNANVVTSCSATPGPFDVVIASPPSTPGTLSVTLCSFLKGSTAPDDVVVTFDFFVPDVDANGQIIIKKDCSNAPVAVKNDILATGNWDPLDPRDPLPTDPAGTTVPINSNLTNVDHLLNAKCLAIQKSVSIFQEFPGGAIGPTPGDVLRYELRFQVSDYFTIGQLVVTDFLADGQTFLGGPAPTLRVTDLFGNTGAPTPFPPISVTTSPNQPAAAAFCPANLQTPQLGTIVRFNVSLAMLILPPFIPRHDAGMLTGGLAAGPPTSTPATGTIVFYARINDAFKPPVSALHKFVDKHDPINNCVSIKGAVYGNLPRPTPLNAPLSIPNSIIGSATDGSAVQTTIVGADLVKTVWAVRRGNTTLCGPPTNGATTTSCSNLPNAPEEVRPGDRVTFRLEKPFPSGDSENVTIEDWLPLPVFNVNDPAANGSAPSWPASVLATCPPIPSPGQVCRFMPGHTLGIPTLTPNFGTNSLTFNYGTFNNTANTQRKADLLFTVTVTAKPFADGLFLTNEARECEDNSFGVRFCQVSIAQVKVREPNLRIRKGVIATNNPNGQFSQPGPPPTANLATAQAPPNATLSLAGISSTGTAPMVSSNDLAMGVLNSDLPGGVDANDIVTFAITIENQGGAPAYDAKLEERLPNCLTNLSNIVVKRGTGAVVNPLLYTIGPATSGPGFTITSIPGAPINAFNPTNGANIIVITFQAQLKADVSPGCCDNVAEIQQYASKPGGLNFVPAGFTPPFMDPAQVCVKPKADKCVVATSEVHTQADNSVTGTPQPPQVAIGEIVRYHLTMTLPEGVSPFFKVTDHLPPGMTYLPGTAKVAYVSTLGINSSAGLSGAQLPDPVGYTLGCLKPNPTAVIPSTLISPSSFTPGDDPTFNLGTLTNNDNDSNLEYVVIEFNALVNNVPTNVDTVQLRNNYEIFLGKVVLGQTPVAIATSNDSDVIIVEPNFTMTKTVAPNPAVKGQTLTYTVQYTNNGTADAFNVELKDTLPAGLTLGTVTAPCPFTNVPLNTLTVTCAQIPKAPNPGSTVIVTYQAVANPATCPVTLNNQARLTWTSLPGLQGTTVNPTGSSTPGSSGAVDGERDGVTPLLTLNDYAATYSAAVKIDCPCEALLTGLKFNDLNGNGIRDTGEPGLANWTIQVTNSNGITHTTTTDSAGNYSLTVPAPGTYTVAEVLQSGWTQTAPTTGTYSVTVSPGQVVTNLNFGNTKKQKCDLQITKEVKPNPLVSGQQATAIITVKNVGGSPCHGPTKVAESMPAGLTLVSASVPGGSCVLLTGVCNYAPAIPAGGSVVFTYVFNVTAQPGAVIQNCATLKNASDSNHANDKACIETKTESGKSGSLTVTKIVKNLWSMPFPAGTNFPVTVSCSPSGPNVTLNLAAGGSQTVNNIAVGSACTVTEGALPPPVPHPACPSLEWGTPAYAPGQTVTIPSTGGSQTVTVTNTYFCNTTPGCATPPPGMVGWWPMDETASATNLQDIIAGNNATTFNSPVGAAQAPQSVTGKVGGAIHFPKFGNGLTGAVVNPQGALQNVGAGDFTIDAWVQVPPAPANQPHYIVKKFDTTQKKGYELYIVSPGVAGNERLEFKWGDGANVSSVQTISSLTTGEWHHVAVTFARNVGSAALDIRLYVDGTQKGQQTGNPPGLGSLVNFIVLNIGEQRSTIDQPVTIDELEIFNRSLSQSEIQSIFNAGPAGKCRSGSLTLTKSVENSSPAPIPAGTTFPITVSCLPSGPNETVNLTAGETRTLDKIPVGSKCTVTEGPLPAPPSSPVCGWSLPTYSAGQSVTISDSGSPQKVSIQNRLACGDRPPIDTYTFTPGMNEFCFSSGGGSFNSPRQIDNPNLPILFNNPTGVDREVRYGAIGLCYGRILTANNKVALKYTFNATPASVLSYSDVVFTDRQGPAQVSETRRNVFGGGLSPIGFQLYFRPQSRIKPFVNTSGGFIFFKDRVPRLNGAQFNFTYDFGGGVQVFRNANRAFTLGYKYQSISNGGRAPNNPGFNGNVFYLGYSIFNGRKIDQAPQPEIKPKQMSRAMSGTYERGPTFRPSYAPGGPTPGGPTPVPLAVHNVGIIPESSGGCPVGSEHIRITMDDEDNKNKSSVAGWTGAISHYKSGTNFEFCKVDGNQFQGHPGGDYAVLKLSDTCPDGSVSFSRTFDNEHNHNNNSKSGDITPNESTSETLMYFCFFPTAPTMTSFPNFGVPYGVFAAPSSAWLATGTVFTDDQDELDGDNTDITNWDGVADTSRFTKIIYGSDKLIDGLSTFLLRGRNTYLLVAKVRN